MNVFRFAPSPTGFLHVGGARTAIFNWLLAKQSGGKFLLRIEDTDDQRSSSEFTQQILNSLKWLGLEWDDSPIFQSQNKQRYLEVANTLLESKKAYHCFCIPEELKQKRANAEKNKSDYVYDKTCLNLSADEIQSNLSANLPFTIRLKTDSGVLTFDDEVMGKISTEIHLIGDIILVRSDGNPVYQLAVVVDDYDMGITNVIRGADHLANTSKQILIMQALNWDIPRFAHLPLILGTDKKRLSKRHGATAVEEFKKKGYLPDALFNYLCLLGWASGDDTELFTKEELTNKFQLKNVNKSNAVFDEEKLKWMNAKYISSLSGYDLLKLSDKYNKVEDSFNLEEKKSVEKLANLVKLRAETFNDFEDRMHFYYHEPKSYNEKGIKKHFDYNSIDYLNQLKQNMEIEKNLEAEKIEVIIRNLAVELGISAAKLIHPLRLALTGDIASPGIFEIVEILGRDKVSKRINSAIDFIKLDINNKTNVELT